MKKFKQIAKHPFFSYLVFSVFLLFIPLFSSFLPITIVDALAKTLIYFIISLGFSLLLGYAGLASLGTAAFIGIGTFVLYSVSEVYQLPFIVVLMVAIIIAIILGIAFGFVSLRIEGMYLAIITLGISEIFVEIFKNLDRFTGGASGTTLIRFYLFGNALSSNSVLYLIIFAVLIAMVATYNLINSPLGRALLAIKNSDSAAAAMGISILKYRLTAFVIAAVYAVLGGVMYMSYVKFSMASSWSLSVSLNILAAVIVGGSKSIWGILLGVFVIFGLDLAVFKTIPSLAQSSFGNVSFIISGVLIIIVMMYFPEGIIGIFRRLYYKYKSHRIKKVAKQVGDINEG